MRCNGGESYLIILAIITDSEGNLTGMIVRYNSWIAVRSSDKILKNQKPEEYRFFINPPVFRARNK